jgi:ribosomal protein S27AE
MPLDDAQLQKFQAWFSSKVTNRACPACGGTNMLTGDIITANVYAPGTAHIGGGGSQMMQLICGDCGYVRLFDVTIMGLV